MWWFPKGSKGIQNGGALKLLDLGARWIVFTARPAYEYIVGPCLDCWMQQVILLVKVNEVYLILS